MFNNKKERDNMKNTILVVEITKFSSGRKNYNIKKNADTLEKATEYLVALKTLNNDADISYELFNVLGQSYINREVA
jgi:hypothetical protein|tara:strand:+ start:208 stop:438 length:231 start_codon:yes stop_codon:yes gene_type:complete